MALTLPELPPSEEDLLASSSSDVSESSESTPADMNEGQVCLYCMWGFDSPRLKVFPYEGVLFTFKQLCNVCHSHCLGFQLIFTVLSRDEFNDC